MKHYLLLLVCLLMSVAAFSQTLNRFRMDSLWRELSKDRQDSIRVLIMIDLAEGHRGAHPDSTLFYGQEALALARQLDFSLGELRAHLAISGVFRSYGNYPRALEEGLKGLEIAERENLKTDQAYAMIRLGNIYFTLNDFRTALDYFLRGNKVVDDTSHPFFYGVTFFRAADAYDGLNMLDSALHMAGIAYDKGVKMDDYIIIGSALRTIGNVYAKKGDTQQALKYYHRSITALKSRRMYSNVADSYIELATFYRNHGETDSAIYYARQASELARPRLHRDVEMKAVVLLSELYETTEPAEALRFLKMANVMRDSVFSVERVLAVQALSFEERERQNELEIARMTYRSRVRQYALMGGIGLLLFVVITLFRNNRAKQNANKLLESQKNKIESTLSDLKSTQALLIQSEKMASLGELTAGIAHEIQNPLNFVNNFSEVNAELIDDLKKELASGNTRSAEELADAVKENEQKINHHGKRADGIVKSMLQHSRTSSGQKEPTDINALCEEYLRLAFHGYKAKDKSFNATFETNFDPSLPRVNIVPQDIGRVVLNLINNAFYAVTERKKENGHSFVPTVFVSTKRMPDKILISVKDNGGGIPQKVLDRIFQPFFTTKPTGQGTGLGLSLSYDIVKAHGGTIVVDSPPASHGRAGIEGEGSEFIIQLPI